MRRILFVEFDISSDQKIGSESSSIKAARKTAALMGKFTNYARDLRIARTNPRFVPAISPIVSPLLKFSAYSGNFARNLRHCERIG
jgi:hypothetical protein